MTPDIIFVDIDMAKLTGFEFMDEVKKNININKISFFICSNGIDRNVEMKAINIGCKGRVQKMPTIELLTDQLRRTIIFPAL